MHPSSNKRFAVLIDGDNAHASLIESMLHEIALYGEATVKRIYGDFTRPNSACWKGLLQKNAIKPVQQFANTPGKNATDSMLIIDAMDLLYSRRFDGFCLVSSDSDFTGLAIRLREEGLTVIGVGEHKTPDAFRHACNIFIEKNIVKEPNITSSLPKPEMSKPQSMPIKGKVQPFDLYQTIDKIIIQGRDEQGWLNIGSLGSNLIKAKPDIDSRHYGFKKLSILLINNAERYTCAMGEKIGFPSGGLYIKIKHSDK